MSRTLMILSLVAVLLASLMGVGWAGSRRAGNPPDPIEVGQTRTHDEVPTTEPERATPEPTENSASPTESPSSDAGEPSDEDVAEGTPPVEATPTDEPEPEPQGPSSSEVAAVQRRLTELKYYVGPIDGEAGAGTASAVMAFQKVNGLGVDGVVGPNTLAALDNPRTPSLRGGASTRVEVDLTRQVAYYVRGGVLQRVLPVSSGSGQTYTTAGGGTARSLTPVGNYRVQRKINGLRKAPLGSLYDPIYFYRGWALHGSNSVPAYPASHGCVRLTRADARWLFPRMPVGASVSLYGGTHTFAVGSSAAGTAAPAGDTGAKPEPKPKPEPTPTPTPTLTPTPTPTLTPTPTFTPTPTVTPEPTPSAIPEPTPTAMSKPTPTAMAAPTPAAVAVGSGS